MKYFVDESGHGGDVVKALRSSNYAGQPVFALACVTFVDELGLQSKVERIKASFNVTDGELKSGDIKKRPRMALELFEALCVHDAEIMIEVVDKRFFVCMNIVSFLLLPFSGQAENDPRLTLFRNAFAEHICEHAPDAVLTSFLEACSSPANQAVKDCLLAVLDALECDAKHDEVSGAICLVARDRLAELATQDPDTGWNDFLPPPDKNKGGKPVWLLPNLSSLMNVYARINLARRGNVQAVEIIHDEQAQFDDILRDGKTLAESISDYSTLPLTPHSDFRFEEAATLQFGRSHEHLGIQLADVLAGFIMQYVKGKPSYRKRHENAFQMLLSLSDPHRGIGINFVMPTKAIRQLGVTIA